MSTKFYLTTPIYYVNDRPHIGHAYSTIVADVIARQKRIEGFEVLLAAGTDENSQKTIDAAAKSGEEIAVYTDRLAEIWQSTWQKLGISEHAFIRTTEERHKKVVEEVWNRIAAKGDIYKGSYEGLYCVGHEAFMKESDLVDGVCPDHKKTPEKIKEENYFFKLSKYQQALLDFYAARPDFIMPENRFHEVKSFVAQGLEDISFSRPTKGWGIPVPGDAAQTIYVWIDALINYISVVGMDGWEKHPADLHMVGKDITRFHAVIWPAMLLSADLPLPKQVGANGFFTIDGTKISKSLGNAVDPLELVAQYGNDALRYFLLREIPYGEDGDFSREKYATRYQSDLANGLGNYAARVLTLGEKAGIMSNLTVEPEIEKKIKETREAVAKKFAEFKFHEVLTAIWELIAFGDAYLNEKAPWKGDGNIPAVYNTIVILDNVAAMLVPFMPETAPKITAGIHWKSPEELTVSKIDNLFPRIEKKA